MGSSRKRTSVKMSLKKGCEGEKKGGSRWSGKRAVTSIRHIFLNDLAWLKNQTGTGVDQSLKKFGLGVMMADVIIRPRLSSDDSNIFIAFDPIRVELKVTGFSIYWQVKNKMDFSLLQCLHFQVSYDIWTSKILVLSPAIGKG